MTQQPTAPSPWHLPITALKALRRADRRSVASMFLSRRLSGHAWADFLIEHRLGVYAYAALQEHTLTALLPPTALARLHDQWRQQQARDARLVAELARISDAFAAAGVDVLLLKGLYLSERFYGRLGSRFTWDLDLLVPPARVGRAFGCLAHLSFRSPRLTAPLHRVAAWVTHAIECRRSDGLAVDLHWALRRLPGLRLATEAVWESSLPYRRGDLNLRVPSDEYTLLLLLLGVAADLDRGLCRMRSLWDVYMLLHGLPGFDWSRFLEQRRLEGSLQLAANALALVLHALAADTEFPELTRALAAHASLLTIRDTGEARRRLALPPHSLDNHLAFARWQPAPAWRYATWWATTLALRMYFARRI